MVPSAPYTAFPRRGERPFTFQWCLSGIFLATMAFQLFTFSDACVLPPPFQALELVDRPKPYYEVGEEVTYKCKRGYDQIAGMLTIATCEKNHTWVPISDDACERRKCSYLKAPKNGKVDYPNGTYQWGAQVHFSCSHGYYVLGKEVIHCSLRETGDDPEWDSKIPTCEKILCKPPPKISNGEYTFSDIEVFEYMEAVTYSCHQTSGSEELSLVGESQLYCAGHGLWSSSPPECKVVKCPYPEVKNGKQLSGFSKKYSYKATIVFECEQGYYMSGSSTVICNGDSEWEPRLPKCLKGYPNPSGGLFDSEFAQWIILLLILIAIVAAIIIFCWLYRYFQHRKKKGTYLTDESHGEVRFTSL